MTLHGVMALIPRYFTEFMYDVVVKSSRSLFHLLVNFLFFLYPGAVRRRRVGLSMGWRSVPSPADLGSGEPREFPQRGPGQSSGRKRIVAYFEDHRPPFAPVC